MRRGRGTVLLEALLTLRPPLDLGLRLTAVVVHLDTAVGAVQGLPAPEPALVLGGFLRTVAGGAQLAAQILEARLVRRSLEPLVGHAERQCVPLRLEDVLLSVVERIVEPGGLGQQRREDRAEQGVRRA